MRSLWQDTVREPLHAGHPLEGDKSTEVLVVGGGMAGMLCAYLLSRRGVPCILVEKGLPGDGNTGRTTAKVTAQHGLLYQKMADKSLRLAQLYYQANDKAVADIRGLAQKIPCEFEEKTAFIYSRQGREPLEREAAAYQRLGIPSVFQEKAPLPFRTEGALGMSGQGQLHPLDFLTGLARGVEWYGHTPVTGIEGAVAHTPGGSIRAKHIILATHYPLVNIPGLYFMKLYQHRSYVIALKDGAQVDGMYLDRQQGGYSFRNYRDFLLVGGGSHRTGKQGGGYSVLRSLAQHGYPEAQEQYHWAAQDCMSLDSRPYIGVHRKKAPGLYVASGFNKWGMSGAMVAATVLTELVTQGCSTYQSLLAPTRSMLTPQLFLNMIHGIGGLLSLGKRCPHMGCALRWNRTEGTWDCPCHGSRFSQQGEVLDNPAQKGRSFD